MHLLACKTLVLLDNKLSNKINNINSDASNDNYNINNINTSNIFVLTTT